MKSEILILVLMSVFLSQLVMGNRLLSQELEAPLSSICDSAYWSKQFKSFSGDKCKFNYENNVWTYDGTNTCVGNGRFDFPCDSSKYICAGINQFGYGMAQAKKAIEAANNGGVHPNCPIVIPKECKMDCQNGGVSIGVYPHCACECPKDGGYSGKLCEIPPQCENTCENGGLVIGNPIENNCGCDCSIYYEGNRCEIEIDGSIALPEKLSEDMGDNLKGQFKISLCPQLKENYDCEQGKIKEKERQLIDQYMALFDRDVDGIINLVEIASELSFDVKRMNSFLKRFDQNHDNAVSKHELMVYFANTRFRLGGDGEKFQQVLNNMIEKHKPENKEVQRKLHRKYPSADTTGEPDSRESAEQLIKETFQYLFLVTCSMGDIVDTELILKPKLGMLVEKLKQYGYNYSYEDFFSLYSEYSDEDCEGRRKLRPTSSGVKLELEGAHFGQPDIDERMMQALRILAETPENTIAASTTSSFSGVAVLFEDMNEPNLPANIMNGDVLDNSESPQFSNGTNRRRTVLQEPIKFRAATLDK